MAEFNLRDANATTKFGCYSERGLMSYFMFVALPTQVGSFLADLRFHSPPGTNVPHPFGHLRGQSPPAVIFSELDFGREGFGSPDGAIFVRCPEPSMVFIEVKLNESYAASCRGPSYNSTIRGQLELRWRLAHLHRNGHRREDDGDTYIQEMPDFKAVYTDDPFYRHVKRQNELWAGSWRRLKITEGVEQVLSYLGQCEDRVYFCAVTKDTDNPFTTSDTTLMPRCGREVWPDYRNRFCWLPVSHLQNARPLPPAGAAAPVPLPAVQPEGGVQ